MIPSEIVEAWRVLPWWQFWGIAIVSGVAGVATVLYARKLAHRFSTWAVRRLRRTEDAGEEE